MVKIDNVEVKIENINPVKFDGTEEFNFGTFIIQNSRQREPYPDFADIDYTINGTNREFTIQSDIVKRLAVEGLYEHTITIVEPVIKLSMYYHPDRKFDTFDGNKVTYLYHLQELIKCSSFGKTSPFTIDSATQTLLNIDAVEQEYIGGDLLNSIIDMFRAVNAIPTLSLDNVIGHRGLNALNNLITLDNSIAEVISSDISDYGSSVYAKLKNTAYDQDKDVSGTFFPAQFNGITPRSSNLKYSDVNAEWHINDGVRKMYRVRIMNLQVSGVGTVTADITQWIIDQDGFGSLEEERTYLTMLTGIYANNTLYFTPDGKLKNGGIEYESTTVPDYIAFKNVVMSYLEYTYSDVSLYVGQNLYDYELEFYYQALRDVDCEVERQYSDKVTKRALITSNQKDSDLELARQGNALKQVINRTGNDKYDITIRYKEGDTIPFLDDYTSNGYKILKMLLNCRLNGYDVTFTMVKNASILNPLTAVNSVVSPFTIQGKSVLTNFVLNEYIEFGGTARTNTSNLSLAGKKALFNALKWDIANNTPIYNAQYTTPDTDTTSDIINLSAEGVPLGTSIMFNAQFRDKKNAGYQLAVDGSFSKKLVAIPYGNVNGQVDDCKFTFMHYTATSPDTHPVGVTATAIIDGDNEEVNLNPNEILGHTRMYHLITDRDNLIIGSYLAEHNSLVQEIATSVGAIIREYPTTIRHTVLDKYAKSGYTGTGTYSIDSGINYMTINVTSGKSWVMCKAIAPYQIYMIFNYIDSDMNRIELNDLIANPHQETL